MSLHRDAGLTAGRWAVEGQLTSLHHGQQYAHKSQISQENEKLLYLCMVMSTTRHTTDRRCARDWCLPQRSEVSICNSRIVLVKTHFMSGLRDHEWV